MGSASVTLGLPSTVLVGRAMPKKVFYDHLKTNAAIKDEFVHKIERIEMLAAIKEMSVHIPVGEAVAEIDVLSIQLSGAGVPYDAIDQIAKTVPNKLLFACLEGESCKLLVKRDKLYETAWLPVDETSLELRGATLDEVWSSLCSQVIFGDADPCDFAGRLSRRNELASLHAQIEKLQKKRAVEKQIAKRNALWDEIKTIENRIEELEAQ